MNTHVKQNSENVSQRGSVRSVSREKSPTTASSFNDNRPSSSLQRKLQNVAHASPRSQQAAQFQRSAPVQMMMAPNEAVATNTVVGSFAHARASVHSWAKGQAWNFSPLATKPSGAVCNHHWGYAYIQQKFLDSNVLGFTVANAAKNTLITLGRLPLIHIDTGHEDTLDTAKTQASVDRADFNDAMNYAIYKICDYPDNLFYWPDRTQTEPDNPATAFTATALPAGWSFLGTVNSPTTAKKKRNGESTRIATGKTTVNNAIS